MKISRVGGCNVKLCAYNSRGKCHAKAINVGGLNGPVCDTFVKSLIKCSCGNTGGEVGACMIVSCRYNECLECVSGRVQVRLNSGMPKCDTFKPGNARKDEV